jgi:hypothetical protein
VVQKIMDVWTLKQAQALANVARRSAPRDRNPNRKKAESARLWRSIKASKVRRLKKFPHTVSRAIAYGAAPKGRSITVGSGGRTFRVRGARRGTRAPRMGPLAPRARHFHLAVLGTKERVQRKTGRRTGKMWGATTNPRFWERASAVVLASANGEVGMQLRNAYDRGIQLEINRLKRKYL